MHLMHSCLVDSAVSSQQESLRPSPGWARRPFLYGFGMFCIFFLIYSWVSSEGFPHNSKTSRTGQFETLDWIWMCVCLWVLSMRSLLWLQHPWGIGSSILATLQRKSGLEIRWIGLEVICVVFSYFRVYTFLGVIGCHILLLYRKL